MNCKILILQVNDIEKDILLKKNTVGKVDHNIGLFTCQMYEVSEREKLIIYQICPIDRRE